MRIKNRSQPKRFPSKKEIMAFKLCQRRKITMDRFKIDQVLTDDGSFTIRHPVYDEEFHSKTGARRETLELYMKASGYSEHLQDCHRPIGILDVGLGLGYNALMTIEFWMQSPGLTDIHMLSLEHTEALVEALTAPDTAWKDGWSDEWKRWAKSLKKESPTQWSTILIHPLTHKEFHWTTAVGDAVDADFSGYTFDFVWQDAFSSKKNPELWTPEWFAKIFSASNAEVSLVTYSVGGRKDLCNCLR